MGNMNKDSEEILKKAIKQAISNSTKRTNAWPPPKPYFLTNYLKKPIGEFIDLSIKEIDGRVIVFFQLSNYKKPPKLDIEEIFRQWIFWMAFFDVESYKSIPYNIIDFEKQTLSEQINFLKDHINSKC